MFSTDGSQTYLNEIRTDTEEKSSPPSLYEGYSINSEPTPALNLIHPQPSMRGKGYPPLYCDDIYQQTPG